MTIELQSVKIEQIITPKKTHPIAILSLGNPPNIKGYQILVQLDGQPFTADEIIFTNIRGRYYPQWAETPKKVWIKLRSGKERTLYIILRKDVKYPPSYTGNDVFSAFDDFKEHVRIPIRERIIRFTNWVTSLGSP